MADVCVCARACVNKSSAPRSKVQGQYICEWVAFSVLYIL